MRVCVIGSGYVGLVTGACLADLGHTVICVDSNFAKVAALKRGEVPIFEPGLEELVSKNTERGHLTFSQDLTDAAGQAEIVMIAVGTPSAENGAADLGQLRVVASLLPNILSESCVVVTKSTVPVGTGDWLEQTLRDGCLKHGRGAPPVASNPEFLREGAAIDDFFSADRIVIGVEEPEAEHALTELYRPLVNEGVPLVVMSRRTAELTKYASNAFLAMKLAFINEMADLCEVADADVLQVAKGMGLDSRIGGKFLQPGPGYGGSCFPKDTLALAHMARSARQPLSLVEATIASNNRRKKSLADRIASACSGSVRGKRIAVLGLTFKPGTDDMREAASLTLIPALQRMGARVCAYDPEGMEAAEPLFENLGLAGDPYRAAQDADALVILTEWNEFRVLDFDRLRWAMANPIIIDLRNVYQHDDVEQKGFTYHPLGRQGTAWRASALAAE